MECPGPTIHRLRDLLHSRTLSGPSPVLCSRSGGDSARLYGRVHLVLLEPESESHTGSGYKRDAVVLHFGSSACIEHSAMRSEGFISRQPDSETQLQ
eukprot:4835483-Amphidinium_carterae.1